MLGAIYGDIVGSTYEFDNTKDYNFELFTPYSMPTDDTYMTLAIAQALMQNYRRGEEVTKKAIVKSMQNFGRRYPHAGYGGMFYYWLKEKHPQPYNSFGNGSGMRVSSVGWLYPTLEETLEVAKWTAEVTHNHPEGIKGAQAIAAAVFLARTGSTKEDIRTYIENTFHYNLNFTLDEIRPTYTFDVTCQGSVPQAIRAFLESNDFLDAIRKAVSLGGDSDTIGCMTGAIAEAFYGMPEACKKDALSYLDEDCRAVVNNFRNMVRELRKHPN